MIFRLAQAQAQLARTPHLLRAWYDGLPDPWLLADEGPDTFSPRDVLAHLIYGERADWMARVRLILADGEGRCFDPFDRRGFLDEARSWSLPALLDEFEALRTANLAELAGLCLTERDLHARGRHPEFGAVTLRELLAAWVVHDLDHVAQAARVMAKRYTSDAGPWINYLPILVSGKPQPRH